MPFRFVLRTLLPALVLQCGCAGPAGPGASLSASSPASEQSPSSPQRAGPAPANVVRGVEPWTFIDRAGRVYVTSSFRLFTTEQASLYTDRMPSFLEAALDRYSTAFAPLPRPRSPMDTYLFANRPQWVRMTQHLMGDEAEKFLRIQRGGFASEGRAIYYNIGVRDTFGLALHEGWHQYTQSVFREPLPVWLEEGIATYMEGFRWDDERPDRPIFMPWANVERYELLRSMHRAGKLMPLSDVFTSRPQDLLELPGDQTLTYYSQIWVLVHFLLEGADGAYRPGLRAALQDAASGALSSRIAERLGPRAASSHRLRRNGPELFLAYFGRDLDAAQREYSAFIERVVAVGAKERIVQGLSPIR